MRPVGREQLADASQVCSAITPSATTPAGNATYAKSYKGKTFLLLIFHIFSGVSVYPLRYTIFWFYFEFLSAFRKRAPNCKKNFEIIGFFILQSLFYSL